jgi:hypothetical protein
MVFGHVQESVTILSPTREAESHRICPPMTSSAATTPNPLDPTSLSPGNRVRKLSASFIQGASSEAWDRRLMRECCKLISAIAETASVVYEVLIRPFQCKWAPFYMRCGCNHLRPLDIKQHSSQSQIQVFLTGGWSVGLSL